MSELEHPLALPTDSRLLQQYLTLFQLNPTLDRQPLLLEVIRNFARLPYENLTKVIRHAQQATGYDLLRTPTTVVDDHARWGTGGTCFSLTATLLHLIRALGCRAEPILADRRYGQNTHCALLVWIDEHPHLVDPGYLITDPIPLDPTREQRRPTTFHELRLRPQFTPGRLDLFTSVADPQNRVTGEQTTYRLTFKTDPVDAGEFLRVWQESFSWEMMSYPVLTSVQRGAQHYLQGQRHQVRQRSSVARTELQDDQQLAELMVREFGIAPEVVRQALALFPRTDRDRA
ncbi:MAG: arylamine N-acetyltransferase [Planctomycetota bacterium]